MKKYTDLMKEALLTKCQTPGVIYNTKIKNKSISIEIELPIELDLSEKEAELLEANIHNMLEIVISKYFKK